MEKPRGAIVDTCVLISKKLEALRTLELKLYVTPVVVLEYLNWALESRDAWLAKGNARKAWGYMRMVELFPSVLAGLGIEILEQHFTAFELEEAVRLVLQREVDPGDALNAITAKRMGWGVVTLDRDWERLTDYATHVIIL